MTLERLLYDLGDAGLILVREGDALAVEGDEIPEHLIDALRRFKPILLKVLPNTAPVKAMDPETRKALDCIARGEAYLAPDLTPEEKRALYWMDVMANPRPCHCEECERTKISER
jgi:hypothetical protein